MAQSISPAVFPAQVGGHPRTCDGAGSVCKDCGDKTCSRFGDVWLCALDARIRAYAQAQRAEFEARRPAVVVESEIAF